MSAYGSSRSGSRPDPLQKRIPKNPKFNHVKATVDSGDSVVRQMERSERKGENVKTRPNELYRRMKITTFVQLIIQISDVEDDDRQPTDSANGDQPFQNHDINARPGTANTEQIADEEILAVYGSKSQPIEGSPEFKSVVVGVGEMDRYAKPIPKSLWSWSYDSSCPYLLLDVRPPDDFENFHIITAHNYPSSMIARSINYETKELLAYRNRPGRLIILYDEEEHVAPTVAKTLCERGYDNIFLLTGGMKLAFRLFPMGFITKGDDVDPRGYTRESVDMLEKQLDGLFADHSVGTRLSKLSTAASRSASSQPVASRMSNSARVLAGRPPFKPA